jgi:RecJ-like exonuclease
MEFEKNFSDFADRIKENVEKNKKILIVSHLDADGLTSGSIIFESLRRLGANVTLRIYPELDSKVIQQLRDSKYDFLIISDLGSSMIEEIQNSVKDFILIDHHVINEKNIENNSVLNAWKLGLDGGRDACSSTISYFLAKALDHRNTDLSVLAVVGSVADRQDCGPKHSLIKLNRSALLDAMGSGYVSVVEDLLLPGRETRPVHESLSLLHNPYVPGISGNRDGAYSALVKAELNLRVAGAWRTFSELTKEEKSKVVEVIVSSLSPSTSFSVEELFGEIYLIELEDHLSPLRDAREYATLLNACGRMGRQDIGISICLGNRSDTFVESLQILSEYRANINKIMQSLFVESSRISKKDDNISILNGRELIPDRLLGPITSIIASSPEFRDKVVIALTNSGDMEVKVSARVGEGFRHNINLGQIIDEIARECGGTGGGHSMAAGAKLPAGYSERFASMIAERIINECGAKIENKMQQQ